MVYEWVDNIYILNNPPNVGSIIGLWIPTILMQGDRKNQLV